MKKNHNWLNFTFNIIVKETKETQKPLEFPGYKLKLNRSARDKKITVMKKRMFLVAICSVLLSVGISNAKPVESRSVGHTRSEVKAPAHNQSPAPKPVAKVNHKPAPVPVHHHPAPANHHRPAPVPPAPAHHYHAHRPAPVPPAPVPAPAPRPVACVASPVATAATVAGVAVVAGLLGAAIASK